MKMVEIVRRDGVVLDARFAQRISTRLGARRIAMLRPHATGKEGVGALVAASAFQAGGDPIVISLKKPGRALKMVEIARRAGAGRSVTCVRRMCLGGVATRRGA